MSQFRLYLHVGLEKTGTTAIQVMLKEQRDVIEQLYGIRLAPGAEDAELTHHRFAKSFIDDPDEAADIEAMTDAEISEFKVSLLDSGVGTFVISSELFVYSGQINIRRLRDIFEGWSVRIVFFVRPQDQYFSSQYSQYIKGLWRESRKVKAIEDFETHSMDYNAFSLCWEEVFGLENVTVAILEDKEFPTIFDHFLCIITGGVYCQGDVVLPKLNINPALSAAHRKIIAEDMFHISDLPTKIAIEKLVRAHSDKYSRFFSPALRHNILSTDQRYSLIKKYEWSNSQLSLRHFGRADLFEADSEFKDYRNEDLNDLSRIYMELIAEALKVDPSAIED